MVYYGTEAIFPLGPKLWMILYDEYKNLTSLMKFKTNIKNCVPQNCPCCLFKTYNQHVGFI